MAITDIYQLTHEQLFDGEAGSNVYFYQRATANGTAADLAAAFVDDMLPLITTIQDVDVHTIGLRVINLGSLTDFGYLALDVFGDFDEGRLPMADAINFSLRVQTRAIRPGSKRYSGIPKTQTTGDFITGAGYISALHTLGEKLQSNIARTTDPLDEYLPVLVKRVFVPATEDKAEHYRLPTTTGELVSSLITGVNLNLEVSSQDTRNNGR